MRKSIYYLDELHEKFADIPDDASLTPKIVAELLNCDEETVRRWCRRGKMPCFNPGGQFVIMGSWFKQFMKASRIKTSGQGMKPN